MGRSVSAELAALHARERDAILRAVGSGGAVEEERLAPLAARWAVALRQQSARLCFGIIGPLCLLVWAVVDWRVGDDSESSELLVLLGGWAVVGALALLIWLLMWRPLLEAEKANLEAAGLSSRRPRRIASSWLHAWFVAFFIGWFVGVVLDVLGVSLVPLRVALWWLLVPIVKRALDRYEAEPPGPGAPPPQPQ